MAKRRRRNEAKGKKKKGQKRKEKKRKKEKRREKKRKEKERRETEKKKSPGRHIVCVLLRKPKDYHLMATQATN